MKNNQLAVIEAKDLQLVPNANEVKNIMEAMELEDMSEFPYGRIKAAAGGATLFEVYEPGDEEPENVQEITGVIVMSHPCNAYWDAPFGKSKSKDKTPVCSSMDGKQGMTRDGEFVACESCPNNQYGTAGDGARGKACKNMRRIYLLRPDAGDIFPLIYTVPPTGLKAYDNYRAQVMIKYHGMMQGVMTKITLKKAQNSDGIAYSTPVFTAVGKLPPAEAEGMRNYSMSFRASALKVGITEDDYRQSDATQPEAAYADAPQDMPSANPDDGFTQVDDDELPDGVLE